MDSDDELVGLFSESSFEDNARDIRVPLAAVPLTTLPSRESSRSQPALAGIYWTFAFVCGFAILTLVTMF